MACDNNGYCLSIAGVTATTIKVDATDEDTAVGEAQPVTLYASDGATVIATGTTGGESSTYHSYYTFTGLTPGTTYIVMQTGRTGTSETVTTLTDNPKVALESQWADLASRIKALDARIIALENA